MSDAGKLLLEAYPLHWPEGKARRASHLRRYGPFKVSLGVARDELLGELRLLGAKDVVPMGECEGFDWKTGCPGHEDPEPKEASKEVAGIPAEPILTPEGA